MSGCHNPAEKDRFKNKRFCHACNCVHPQDFNCIAEMVKTHRNEIHSMQSVFSAKEAILRTRVDGLRDSVEFLHKRLEEAAERISNLENLFRFQMDSLAARNIPRCCPSHPHVGECNDYYKTP
jgi:hypothetical protein